ncbi:hypothetical protein SAMN06269185_0565 [Natronoarchaeum philippinense]|uniref:TIGR04206 family protein n=1 Tax=Natronoarchaeum philippinense TaxID=558529 RepID=A0A285N9T9_NATPI|nr:hypothetical protein [Natronoarchaeum philippinense]SNZ04451.1 hypothetical protein SAMN06269185_0565 [Natronoarchaeum philippinense]
MAWVRSEYAGELAVVAAWLAAVLPWNVTYTGIPGTDLSALFLRFPFLQTRYIFGLPRDDQRLFYDPVAALDQVSGVSEMLYYLWIAGAAVVLLAVLLSFAMYAAEDAVEELSPVHPVRAMGGLLALATAFLTAATVAIATNGDFGGGIPIPVGLVVLGSLAAVLLRAELV